MEYHRASCSIETLGLLLGFWESLHRALGTKLRLNSAYHLQTDDQSECTIRLPEFHGQ